MITRKEIRDLAEFQSARGCAVTFYYQPDTPPNQSHRDEAILVKDLARGALREAEKEGRNDSARVDLSRILEMAERLHGNAGKAKAIFADSSQNFWREFDIPAWLDRTSVMINRRFHLRPLAPLLEVNPRVCVCVGGSKQSTAFRLPERNLQGGYRILQRVAASGRKHGRRRLRCRTHLPACFRIRQAAL